MKSMLNIKCTFDTVYFACLICGKIAAKIKQWTTDNDAVGASMCMKLPAKF